MFPAGVVLILELHSPGHKPTKFTQTSWVNNAAPAALGPAKHMAGESGQDFFTVFSVLYNLCSYRRKMRLARLLDPCVYLLANLFLGLFINFLSLTIKTPSSKKKISTTQMWIKEQMKVPLHPPSALWPCCPTCRSYMKPVGTCGGFCVLHRDGLTLSHTVSHLVCTPPNFFLCARKENRLFSKKKSLPCVTTLENLRKVKGRDGPTLRTACVTCSPEPPALTDELRLTSPHLAGGYHMEQVSRNRAFFREDSFLQNGRNLTHVLPAPSPWFSFSAIQP